MQQNDPKQISGATVAVGAAEPFESLSQPAGVQFLLQGLQPPSRVYIGVDDQLSLQVRSPRQNAVFTVGYRLLRTDGLIIPFMQQFNFTAGVNQVILLPLTEGFLLSLDVQANAGTLQQQTWIRVDIARQVLAANTQTYETLIAGYLDVLRALSYPETPPARGTDGRGAIVSITGATPAAGAEINEVVPTGRIWRLIEFDARFVASAAVATRAPSLVVDDGTFRLYRAAPNFSLTAGQGAFYLMADGIPYSVDTSNSQNMPLPCNQMMGQGFRIVSSTSNIQAGDQWDTIHYLVEEWICP